MNLFVHLNLQMCSGTTNKNKSLTAVIAFLRFEFHKF